jgi:transglutaminase-like putative cysteine protease
MVALPDREPPRSARLNGCGLFDGLGRGVYGRAMFLDVQHHLWLEYDEFIRESFIELRLQPKTTQTQTVASFVLAAGPPTRISRYRDWNDNVVHHFAVTQYHDRLEVQSRSLVETRRPLFALAAIEDAGPLGGLSHDLQDWLFVDGPLTHTPRLEQFAAEVDVSTRAPLGEQVRRLSAVIAGAFTYRKNVTRYDSTTEEFLELRAGVCQDFTHLMLALLRLRGIPCRYVSGYLHVERSAVEPAQSHAWIEFYSPRAGWVPFDPTHDREIDERYVVVAHGRHYDDVPPNKGIYRGNARETLRAEVRTQVTASKGVVDLHEEIRQIDLPVFQEPPERRRPLERVITRAEEAAIQQQQQQ